MTPAIRSLLLIALVSLSGAAGRRASAGELAAAGSFKALEAAFPGNFSVLKGTDTLVEFCPDNTCYAFEVSGSVRSETAAAFIYLYLFYSSEYIYTETWQGKPDVRLRAEQLANKISYGECRAKRGGDAAVCALNRLLSENKVRLFYVVYDEKERAVSPVDKVLLARRMDISQSCRIFVREFYNWYMPMALTDYQQPASMFAVRKRPEAFGDTLLKALNDDFKAQADAKGEIVGLDFDPFLNSQDPAEKYVVGKVVVAGGKCVADIKAVDGKPGVCDVKAELRQVGGKWRFIEFRYQDRTLSEILTALKENRRPFPDQYAEAARQAEKNYPAGFLKLYSLAEEGNSAEWAEVSRDTLCELLYNKTALWVKVFSSVEQERLKRYLENGGLAVLDLPTGVKSPEDFSKEVAAKLKKTRLIGKEKELAVYLEALLLKK